MMNNRWVIQQAQRAAQRLLEEQGIDDGARVARAFRWTLGRPPGDNERRLAECFLSQAGGDSKRRLETWGQFVQTLFASADFRYVE